ncbi:citrate synthase [Bacillus sp. Marseille-P3800]|uniref:citrate synthase n=1 Tax=Bacillus sp. Marseille-P3800 TaxID=2014782 RepID=UPI000C081975|nr:citrate synthase [Bacillus sp. Marseille-P3800]
MAIEQSYYPGLDGVIAAETDLSFLDTEQGEIVIHGYDLIELSKSHGYLDIVHLLLQGTLPTSTERTDLAKRLSESYDVPEVILDVFKLLPASTHPMDALRTGISVLASYDHDLLNRDPEVNRERGYQLLAKLPAIVANSYRVLEGKEIMRPKEELSYSANFLYMITGKEPTELEERVFDQSLVLYSEHEMPNSTFTARVIASTLSDMYGAMTGAVASLKGHLHGGANEAVMYMLLDANTPEEFETLLANKLKQKEKIMGFGHRVYMKKMDPRAQIMKEALAELSEAAGDDRLLRMCEAGEALIAKEKGLYPNLDYYAAPVYWMLGIPIGLYTPIFLSSRTVGLSAHVIEQHENNKLFRPRVKYTGPRHTTKSK